MIEISEKQRRRIVLGKAWIKSTAGEWNEEVREKARQIFVALLGELDGLSDEQLDFSPGEGEWTVREVCRHVAQAVPQVTKAVGKLADGTALPDVDSRAIARMIDDPGDFATLRNRVSTALEDCAESVDRLAENPDLSLRSAHPFFGSLNCRGWVAFNIMHANLHRRQIQRIKASPGYPS